MSINLVIKRGTVLDGTLSKRKTLTKFATILLIFDSPAPQAELRSCEVRL